MKICDVKTEKECVLDQSERGEGRLHREDLQQTPTQSAPRGPAEKSFVTSAKELERQYKTAAPFQENPTSGKGRNAKQRRDDLSMQDAEEIAGNEELNAIFRQWVTDYKAQKPHDKKRLNIKESLRVTLNKSIPMRVSEAIVFPDNNAYWICPNCKSTFEREGQAYCDRCGQKLKWPSLKKIQYITQEEYAKHYF